MSEDSHRKIHDAPKRQAADYKHVDYIISAVGFLQTIVSITWIGIFIRYAEFSDSIAIESVSLVKEFVTVFVWLIGSGFILHKKPFSAYLTLEKNHSRLFHEHDDILSKVDNLHVEHTHIDTKLNTIIATTSTTLNIVNPMIEQTRFSRI